VKAAVYGWLVAGALIAGSPAASLAATPAEDRFMIMELMDRYGIVHDFGTPQEFADLFTDDAVIASGGNVTTSGRDALLKRGEQDQRRHTFEGSDGKMSSFMRHVISNRQVKLTSATGHSEIELLLNVNRTRQATLVLVTHDPELAAVADISIALRDGRVVRITDRAAAGVPS
jgi:hypothetical protein